MPADVVFDAGTDLYKVRAGRFASREDAERGRAALQPFGLGDSWMVAEGGELENAAMVVDRSGKTYKAAGRWLEVTAPAAIPGSAGTAWSTAGRC